MEEAGAELLAAEAATDMLMQHIKDHSERLQEVIATLTPLVWGERIMTRAIASAVTSGLQELETLQCEYDKNIERLQKARDSYVAAIKKVKEAIRLRRSGAALVLKRRVPSDVASTIASFYI